jgi:tetratricopeptide (TPR) repeat protein
MMLPSGTEVQKLLEQYPIWKPAVFVLIFIGAVINSLRGQGAFTSDFKLRKKGLDLLLEGQPIEAEKCYREALGMSPKVSEADRVRLLVCLGDALLDQHRCQESKECLDHALLLGDPSGSCQGSMADLLIEQGTDPQKAFEMAEQAMALSTNASNQHFGERWSAANISFRQAKGWARKAQALLQLGKRTEARQAIDRALKFAESADAEMVHVNPETSMLNKLILGSRLSIMKKLTIVDAHWSIGLALVAMGDKTKAAEHFRIAPDSDPKGKYRLLAKQQLEELGPWAT